MKHCKEILHLLHAGTTIRSISATLHVSTKSIQQIINAAREKDIGWDTVLKVTIYIKNKHVTLKRSMDGIDDMDAFLLRHVDPEKIITKKRKS